MCAAFSIARFQAFNQILGKFRAREGKTIQKQKVIIFESQAGS